MGSPELVDSLKQNYTDPWLLTADEDKEQTFSLINSNDLEPLILIQKNTGHLSVRINTEEIKDDLI